MDNSPKCKLKENRKYETVDKAASKTLGKTLPEKELFNLQTVTFVNSPMTLVTMGNDLESVELSTENMSETIQCLCYQKQSLINADTHSVWSYQRVKPVCFYFINCYGDL